MNRRELLKPLGIVLVAWPITGQAQQVGKIYRIGFLRATENDRRGGEGNRMESTRLSAPHLQPPQSTVVWVHQLMCPSYPLEKLST